MPSAIWNTHKGSATARWIAKWEGVISEEGAIPSKASVDILDKHRY